MPTHAAGTFALNCAYWGIPCIGYRGLDTQEQLHPHTTVDFGDLEHARGVARLLVKQPKWYDQCSKWCKKMYEEKFSEKVYIYNMKRIIKEVMSNE